MTFGERRRGTEKGEDLTQDKNLSAGDQQVSSEGSK